MRMQAFIAFMALVAAAASSYSSSSASAESVSGVQRELSPFVRRNLVHIKSKVQVQAQFSPARTYYMGRQPRRLADGDCSADATVCGTGQPCCDGVCVDLNTNMNNCGHCRYKCAFSLSCCSGKCVNLQTDPRNCGACGTVCTVACSMGFCGYAG